MNTFQNLARKNSASFQEKGKEDVIFFSLDMTRYFSCESSFEESDSEMPLQQFISYRKLEKESRTKVWGKDRSRHLIITSNKLPMKLPRRTASTS